MRRTVTAGSGEGGHAPPDRRSWKAIGCAALIGAAIAFPLGMIAGGDGPSPHHADGAGPPRSPRGQAPPARNVYSPRVASDPFVIEQQTKVVEALELSCRRYKLHCMEAAQARLRIEEAEGRRPLPK